MTEEAIKDYAADAEIAPKRRGRPPKSEEAPATVTVFVEDAPPVEAAQEPAAVLSEQTKLEIEMGRRVLAGYK